MARLKFSNRLASVARSLRMGVASLTAVPCWEDYLRQTREK